jgi:hypothetical protein
MAPACGTVQHTKVILVDRKDCCSITISYAKALYDTFGPEQTPKMSWHPGSQTVNI